MNIWEILGIYETTNIQVIKKAFASKSKECHPEDKPEEFKQLRNAYKVAMKYAKNNADNGNKTDNHNSSEDVSDSKYVSFEFGENAKEQKKMDQQDTKTNGRENISDKPKTLFERMHGSTPKIEIQNEQVKAKSLFERMHGEAPKIENVGEQVKTESKSLYERMHAKESTETSGQESGEFKFDHIIDDRDLKKYIDDFRIIFSNPFLRNNILFWEIYLNSNWNGALLRNNYVEDMLVSEMCKYQGWFEITLRKLEEKMKISLERVRNNKVKIQEMATDYQRGYDNFIMDQVEKNGFEKNLNNEASIKCYVSIYFRMVRDKRIRV